LPDLLAVALFETVLRVWCGVQLVGVSVCVSP
jgi:hypothetical protein